MAVNCLTTSLIVFKILKLFLEIKDVGDTITKYRHIIFVIIESGMTLFVIQLVRMVLYAILVNQPSAPLSPALNYVLVIGEICNVIISPVHF